MWYILPAPPDPASLVCVLTSVMRTIFIELTMLSIPTRDTATIRAERTE